MTRQRRDAPRAQAAQADAFGRIQALLADFAAEHHADIEQVRDHLQRSENRTELGFKQLQENVTRELAHINQRVERFHELTLAEIGHVRQELHDHERLTAETVARGATAGAAEVAARIATKPKSFFHGWKGWAVTVGAMVAGFAAFVEGMPKVLVWLEGFWAFLKGDGS